MTNPDSNYSNKYDYEYEYDIQFRRISINSGKAVVYRVITPQVEKYEIMQPQISVTCLGVNITEHDSDFFAKLTKNNRRAFLAVRQLASAECLGMNDLISDTTSFPGWNHIFRNDVITIDRV
jgi:hypothetical protein